MKLWRKVVLAAVLLGVPVCVQAQTVTQDGSRTDPGRTGTGQGMVVGGIDRTDTTMVIQTYNSDGSAVVKEASPNRDANLTFQDIINNFGASALALNAADSSAVLDTHDMRLGMLLIKAVIAGTGTVDTTVTARLAIQIRTHLGGVDDSMSTFPIYEYGQGTMGAGAGAAVDTVTQGHLYSATSLTGISATPGAFTTWSGEISVHISAKRNAHGNGFAINGHTFYYPNGIAIPLSSMFGRDIYSPYTSVRIRVMSVQKGAASLTTGTVFVAAHLVGTPL